MERVLLLLLTVVSCIQFCYPQDQLCQEGYRCTDGNSTCFDGYCVCQHGFYRPTATDLCTTRILAGATCDNNTSTVYQCADYPAAFCKAGTCQCNDTHYVNNTHCAERLNAGSPCHSHGSPLNQCVDRATCESDICKCQPAYYNVGGICTTRKNVSEACNPQTVDQNQCAENSYCYRGNSTCICVKGYYKLNDTFCHESIQLTGVCNDQNTDPKQCADPFAYCQSNVCDCDEAHYHNKSSNACEERLTAGVVCNASTGADSKQCVVNARCSHFEGGSINTSTCVCNHGSFVENGDCKNSTEPSGHGPSLTHPPGLPLPPIDELFKGIG